jgi:hypothetical protein
MRIVDQRPELLADLRVEPDRGLVHENQAWTVHERPRDQQPPAHAAGQLVHSRVATIHEVRHLQRAFDRLGAIRAPDSVQVREDEQVLLHGERRVEVVELRHDAAFSTSRLRLAG